MDAPVRGRHEEDRSRAAGAAESGRSTGAGRAGAFEDHARLFVSLVRGLERNWPVSVALIFLAFMALSLLGSG